MAVPTRRPIDEPFRGKVGSARRMPPEQRLRAPGEPFDGLCERMRAGIRGQFPEANEQRVVGILRERLEIARRLQRLP